MLEDATDDLPARRPDQTTTVATTPAILSAQNTSEALELLLAQRRMYRRARRWNYLRIFGIGVIAIAVPVAVIVNADAAEVGLAVAGAWTFLSRTWFIERENRWTARAAAVQEAFDVRVFGIPVNRAIVDPPKPEWISDILADDDVPTAVAKEHLSDWYSLHPEMPAIPAVAICQRSNSVYSERLLNRHASCWLAVAAGWFVVATLLALVTEATLEQLLLGVILPILPAVLDAKEQWALARTSATDRGRLADEVERRVRAWPANPLTVEDLRSFQDQVYRQRRDGPLIPEFLYRYARKENERAMNRATEDLWRDVASHMHDRSSEDR